MNIDENKDLSNFSCTFGPDIVLVLAVKGAALTANSIFTRIHQWVKL
jgi:hypothetical protein